MANGENRKRVAGYALGMVHEAAWILGMTALALSMAFLAEAIWR
ncbi:MAG: hypothetical protein Q7W16_06220 [Coriobacteriia bacterium]|nr:hypothetical protein [Coriobacteriia bacterium]